MNKNMQYSKGDTIELYCRMALILDDGIPGKKFVEQYEGQVVTEIYNDEDYDLHYAMVFDSIYWNHYVWYYVLTGDKKGWYAV